MANNPRSLQKPELLRNRARCVLPLPVLRVETQYKKGKGKDFSKGLLVYSIEK
jgi:hypothetical protein